MILALDAIQVILVYVVTGHNVIVEATKASGEVMVTQMRDMAAASWDLERSKIEVQLKLFAEQMAYQRKKDRRLYENAVIANENAHLAIQKQGEVVSCLSQLSSVLSLGLKVSSNDDKRGAPHAVPTVGASTEALTNTGNGTACPSTSYPSPTGICRNLE
jgi:hypothetical protein